jgi:NAD(P)-dependent dehydrogenase (short-subunit alcohol dehydrogenase family)
MESIHERTSYTGSGTIVYIGSTTSRIHEPFLESYIASKAAGDALAEVMSFELRPFGIDSIIVSPGAFTEGTEHFAHAHGPRDHAVVRQYGALPERAVAARLASRSMPSTRESKNSTCCMKRNSGPSSRSWV